MAEPIAFATLLREAARLSFEKPRHFSFMGIYGFIAACTLTFAEYRPLGTFEATDMVGFTAWLATNRSTFLLSLTIATLATLIQALIRGPFILILEDTLLSQTKTTEVRPALNWPRLKRGAMVSFSIAALFALLSLLLLGLLFFPVLLALKHNPGVAATILELAIFLFLVLSVLFYAIKEYTLYYALLGHLRLRPALELGYALFRRQLTPTLLFGALLFGISLLFTFLLDSAIISSAALGFQRIVGTFLFGFLLVGWFSAFEQALRLLFFHHLAAPRQKTDSEERLIAQENTSKTPA